MFLLIIVMIIISRNIFFIIMIRELILVFIILKILDRKNIILFYILNLVRRFILFLSLLWEGYGIFCLGNMIKLGLFPFTYIILIFYANLRVNNFIILNIAKLPYLTLINLKVLNVITILTLLYVIYHIFQTNNLILMITIYSVLSTVVILNLPHNVLNIYYTIRLIGIYICFINGFETICIYNLLRLPLRLTFYMKIQFIISLRFSIFILFLFRLTLTTLNMAKFMIRSNRILSKKMIGLLGLNALFI